MKAERRKRKKNRGISNLCLYARELLHIYIYMKKKTSQSHVAIAFLDI